MSKEKDFKFEIVYILMTILCIAVAIGYFTGYFTPTAFGTGFLYSIFALNWVMEIKAARRKKNKRILKELNKIDKGV